MRVSGQRVSVLAHVTGGLSGRGAVRVTIPCKAARARSFNRLCAGI